MAENNVSDDANNSTDLFSAVLYVTDSDATNSERTYNGSQNELFQHIINTSNNSFKPDESITENIEKTSWSIIDNSQINGTHETVQQPTNKLVNNSETNNHGSQVFDSTNYSSLPKQAIHLDLIQSAYTQTDLSSIEAPNSSLRNKSNSPVREKRCLTIRSDEVEIAARINVNIKLIKNSSSSESDLENAVPDQKIISQDCGSSNNKKAFIDYNMMKILTKIYGDAWRSSKMINHCIPNNIETKARLRQHSG
ncbi:uncharacterized protein LOC128735656 isoform X2 [Sabethes cyaneus]|uniref:uncharacterized protein LOC128735656 isoform X2 n=1 Tax=Sabethes cyaneus TaxID=53552 RepID=UPI00237DC5CE|nr:uncharacterized protein LOC128735656 isoform X2 [Sabethes cyaneus]